MICAGSAFSSSGETDFTEPCVPTGMKIGVSIVPCAVVRRPRRACEEGSVWSNWNMRAAE
jgi:hypothetical protein